ncbi:MAG: O-antigen ligase family protein [Candidatus Krumholzibacteriia bacterium]
MNLELYGKAIDLKRFMLFVAAPLACCAVAAVMFLPASFMRLALMLLFALPFVFLCVDRPAIIFYLVILILFSNLDVYAPFRLYRYAVIFLLASFAIAVANGRRIVTHHPHLIALAFAFVILAFQSLSVAREYGLAARKLGAFIKVLIAVVIVVQFTRDRKEFRRFLLVLVGGILLSDYLPFIVHPPGRFASLSMLWSQGIVRYEGFVFEPNTFALFQLFLIPVLIFFAGAYRKPRIARPFFAFLIIASIGVLALSFSRGGFVGLACLLLTLVVVERRNKPLFLFGLSLIAASIVFIPGVYWERIGSVFDFATKRSGDFAIWTRLETMRVALRLGLAHPLLGVGIDNFLPSAAYFIPIGLTVHSMFLQIFSELGFVALSLFIGIIICNFRIIRRMMKNESDPEVAQIGRALFIQHIAMLVSSIFLPVLFDMIVWFMLALPAIAEHAYRSESRSEGAVPSVSIGRK